MAKVVRFFKVIGIVVALVVYRGQPPNKLLVSMVACDLCYIVLTLARVFWYT
jgi:mannitol-specific phosphotransferase system IIBC component